MACVKWRLPFKNLPPRGGTPHAALVAARVKIQFQRKCERIIKRTGKRCGEPAYKGAKFCRHHGGLIAAAKAEAELYGRPVIIRRKPRKTALGTLGATAPLREGMPLWMDRLGPFQRGRAIEAWDNRLMAPEMWAEELTMPRYYLKPLK